MSTWSPADFGLPLPWIDALTATGTTQATAFLLTKKINVFATVAASSGAMLPGSYAPGSQITVMNRGANTLTLYPAPGDVIESGSVNASISISAGGNATLMLTGNPMGPEPMQWRLVASGLANGQYLPLAGGAVTGATTFGSTVGVTGALTTTGGISVPVTGTINYPNSARTFSGTSFTQIPLFWQATILGAVGNYGSLAPVGSYFNAQMDLDATLSGGATLGLYNVTTAAAMKGGATAFVDKITVNVAGLDTVSVEYVAGRDWAYSFVPGGVSGTIGSLIGRTTVASLQSGATTWAGMTGQEIAVEALSGSSVRDKTGLYILQYADDVVQGSGSDQALGFWRYAAQDTNIGWNTIISIGSPQHGAFYPGAKNGYVMRAYANLDGDSLLATGGIDLSAMTFATFSLKMPNFMVDPTGAITALSIAPFAAGNQTLNIYGGGTSGVNVSNTNGTIAQFGGPGATIGATFTFTAAAAAGAATIGVSQSNASIQIQPGTTGLLVLAAGNVTTVDHAGNLKAPTFNVGANQVVGARQTGWTAMTGTPDNTTAFATSTVTLAQLAGRVMAMQTALTTHGLIGA